jgi:hypothetical protein
LDGRLAEDRDERRRIGRLGRSEMDVGAVERDPVPLDRRRRRDATHRAFTTS